MTTRQKAAVVAAFLLCYGLLWLHIEAMQQRRIDADRAVVATNCHVFRIIHQHDPNC